MRRRMRKIKEERSIFGAGDKAYGLLREARGERLHVGRLFDDGLLGRVGIALERAFGVATERPPGF